MICYKCLATKRSVEDSEKLDRVSVIALFPAETLYVPGQWAEAPKLFADMGYHLLVFDSAFHALDFIDNSDSREIWRCEVEDIVSPIPRKFDFYSMLDYAYELSMGKVTEELSKPSYKGHWPVGTLMVKRVKILNEIQWDPISKSWSNVENQDSLSLGSEGTIK